MPEGREVSTQGDDPFQNIYDHLSKIVAELATIRRTHIMIMSGPDLATLVAIEDDEHALDHDVHLLERRLDAHQQ